MFDFDAGKFLIIGVVALIVIGPKELPRVLRQIGQAVGRVKRMAAEFQGQFMDAMKEADIESIRQDLKKISDDADAQLNAHFDPARDIQRELTASLEEPAVAAAVPAMAEVTGTATETFALSPPDPAAAPLDDDAVSTAAMGIAPSVGVKVDEVADAVGSDQGALNGAAHAVPPRKRKIIVAKRRGADGRRTHAVCDRTQSLSDRVARR